MKVIEAIRKANAPRPPEESVALRVACAAAVLVALLASTVYGELSWPEALAAMALVVAGMAFSWATRHRPPGWVKVVVALGAVSAMVWFGVRVQSGPVTDLAAVETTLTVLFVWILVVHSFHVPAGTDLMFSLVSSAGLVAVAATQASGLAFAVPLLAWLACAVWALVERWRAESGRGSYPVRGLPAALAGLASAAIVAFLLLPAPGFSTNLNVFEHQSAGGPVTVPVAGALAGDGGQPAELSKAATQHGPTRVGGYLGFAGDLDTAVRGNLGHTVVMRVRASVPSYWVGETFDTWSGRSWTESDPGSVPVRGGSPFQLPEPAGHLPGGRPDLQTFYVVAPSADLVFHAGDAREVWFPSSTLFAERDGTVVSPVGIGTGAVYTVESTVAQPAPDVLRQGGIVAPTPASVQRRYTRLPHPYRRAAALARSVTAGTASTYAAVEDLIGWLGSHTRYSTDIPPLPAGADTVNEFLFGDRVGYCEQISTALAVMLRTLRVPVREVVGYVPGGYDPVTGLYVVRADDAHAWVQVWIPGYGWQSFDPTASVPLANPSPGAAALADIGHALGKVPWPPVLVGLAALGLAAATVEWCRRRPRSWAEAVAREIDRAGRRRGRPRRPGETLVEHAAALDRASGEVGGALADLAARVEADVYGGRPPPAGEQPQLVVRARQLARR